MSWESKIFRIILVLVFSFRLSGQTKPFQGTQGVCEVPLGWGGLFAINHLPLGSMLPRNLTGEISSITNRETFDRTTVGAFWKRDSTDVTIQEAKECIEAWLPETMIIITGEWHYDKLTDTWIHEAVISAGGMRKGKMSHFNEKRTTYLRYRNRKAFFLEIATTSFMKSIEEDKEIYEAIYASWKVN